MAYFLLPPPFWKLGENTNHALFIYFCIISARIGMMKTLNDVLNDENIVFLKIGREGTVLY